MARSSSNRTSRSLVIVMTVISVVLGAALLATLAGVSLDDEGPTLDVVVRAVIEQPELKNPLPGETEVQNLTLRSKVDDPGIREQLLARAIYTPAVAIWFAISLLLLKIARTSTFGEPFSTANIRRLRYVSFVMFASPVILLGSSFARKALIEGSAIGELADPRLMINFAGIAAGVLVLALADAIDAVVKARKDIEGLV